MIFLDTAPNSPFGWRSRMTLDRSYIGRKSNETLLQELLVDAESVYGPRLGGVTAKINEGDTLATNYDPKNATATVVIPRGNNENDRRGQIAQECIHVLSPATTDEACVFDIGLATHFTVEHVKYPAPADF